MARRKTAEVEVLPPDEPPKRTRKKLVDAKHVITYDAPVPVEIEETPPDDESALVMQWDQDINERKRKAPAKNAREEFKKKMRASGASPNSPIKVSIDKYQHSDSPGGGTWGDTEHCTKYGCSEDHVINLDYLEVCQKWGHGLYRITIRMDNKIVDAFDRRIIASNAPVTNGATMNGMEGVPPPMAYQMSMPGQPPLTFNDYLKQMAQTKKLMDEISGTVPIPPQQSEEVALASLLLKDPANAKRMARNLLGGEGEKDMMALAIENGPAIIQAFGDMVLKIISDVRSTNGTQTMGAQALAHQTQNQNKQWIQGAVDSNQGSMEQTQINAPPSQVLPPGNSQPSPVAPDEQILSHLFNYVIEQCRTQTAPELVAAGVDRFMDEQVGNDFPLYFDKVWSQLENFAGMDADIVLAYVKTLPGGATVADMPHAKDWLIKLQELLKPEAEVSA